MKNDPIDPYASQDIREQVAKVLRGLGNPEPPLRLADVRALLGLDRQYYSSTNTGALQEWVSKVKVGTKRLAMRATLIVDVIRKAGLKGLWLPESKRILIDEETPDLKKRHVEAHEIIHSVMPHHRLFLLGDDRETLQHTCHEKLEAEANFGSGRLLFLLDRFAEEARDLPSTIKTVLSLKKTFGNTITMTLWRLIEEARPDEPLFGVVSVHPRFTPEDFDPSDPCKYFIESPAFRERFGNVTEVEAFGAMQSYSTWARGGPLGQGEAVFAGRDGQRHRFCMETFFNSHESLTLGTYLAPVRAQVVVP